MKRWAIGCLSVWAACVSSRAAYAAEEPPESTPSNGSPIAVSDAPYAHVKLVSKDARVAFHVRTGTGHGTTSGTVWSARSGVGAYEGTTDSETYQRICDAPCTARIQTGRQKLALSSGEGAPVAVEEPVNLSGPATIEGQYRSNAGFRAAGLGMLFVGTGALVAGAVVIKDRCDHDEHCNREPYVEIAAAGLFMGLMGAILVSFPDVATVTVTPGVPAAQWRPGMLVAEGARAEAPMGLTVSLRF
jgi:hypothetical protein